MGLGAGRDLHPPVWGPGCLGKGLDAWSGQWSRWGLADRPSSPASRLVPSIDSISPLVPVGPRFGERYRYKEKDAVVAVSFFCAGRHKHPLPIRYDLPTVCLAAIYPARLPTSTHSRLSIASASAVLSSPVSLSPVSPAVSSLDSPCASSSLATTSRRRQFLPGAYRVARHTARHGENHHPRAGHHPLSRGHDAPDGCLQHPLDKVPGEDGPPPSLR